MVLVGSENQDMFNIKKNCQGITSAKCQILELLGQVEYVIDRSWISLVGA